MALNVNDKLIREDLPNKLGVDGLAIVLFLATHIRSKNRKVWPHIHTIRQSCKVEIKGELVPMPRERAYRAIKRAITEEIITRKQENSSGDFGKVKYRLATKYISIYMGVSEFELEADESEEEHRDTETRNTETRDTENRTTEVINKSTEVINKLKAINEGPTELKSKKHRDLLCKLNQTHHKLFIDLSSKKIELLIEWLNFRTELRQNYKTTRGINSIIRLFSAKTEDDIRYLIDYSTTEGREYSGLFPEQLKKRDQVKALQAQYKDRDDTPKIKYDKVLPVGQISHRMKSKQL